ncbi:MULTISPECIES: hypothetical protein [Legionella]|uniref:Uncharacterized protein n=1 Tax=Legionella drozanskii LLAP-1 TaxID=1212489 RepID=A0A0W0SQ85_9GAMM|nr:MULTISPECIES: hypothetical protein [Legionella]KTC85443.1 hypothetical protein Ldro_2615 [Legionella drozanskii LLAP-1]PJE05872.1 MAG: hypothetical protein CK430_15200 [Legionella sp.]
MKKLILSFLSLLITSLVFAQNIVVNNQTNFPNKNKAAKIAIQWANSAKDIQKSNKALMYGLKLNPSSLQVLLQLGMNELSIPESAKHFRVLVWSEGKTKPNLLTNWVDVMPNKTYNLLQEQLAPTVLMVGTGC